MGGSSGARAQSVAEQLLGARRLFRPKDLAAHGVSTVWIDHLRLDHVVVLQPPGVLTSPQRLHAPAVCAAARWPQAVLTGPSALSVRGLWRDLARPWLAIDGRAHRPITPMPIALFRSRGLKDDPDVEHVEVGGVTVRAFSVDRALVDLLRFLERVPSASDVASALQAALQSGAVTPASLERCARAKKQWPAVRAAIDVLGAQSHPSRTGWPTLRQYLPLRASPWDRLYNIAPRSLRWSAQDIRETDRTSVSRDEATQIGVMPPSPATSRASP